MCLVKKIQFHSRSKHYGCGPLAIDYSQAVIGSINTSLGRAYFVIVV